MEGMLWAHGLTGSKIATCSLIHLYVQSPSLEETGPLVSRFLAFAVRAVFEIDPPAASLEIFLEQLVSALANDGEDLKRIEEIVKDFKYSIQRAATVTTMHDYFNDTERLLLRDEMFDEFQNVTVRPAERQIDETSPFGHYLHRILDAYLTLEDDEYPQLITRITDWIQNDSQADIVLTAEEEINLYLRQGEYAAARAKIQGSFDKAPAAMLGRNLPDTLLQNAKFHVKTQAYSSAKISLEEALRLARGLNDNVCISECDDLLKQIKFEERQFEKRPTFIRPNLNKLEAAPLKIDHKREAYVQYQEGYPFFRVLQAVEKLQNQASKELNGKEESYMCELDLLRGKLWQSLGSSRIASIWNAAAQDDAILLTSWTAKEHDLNIALAKSAILSIKGREEEAIKMITKLDIIDVLDVKMLQNWQAECMRILYRWASRTNSQGAIEAIISLRSEVQREVGYIFDENNFKTIDREFGKVIRTTEEQDLMLILEQVRLLRQSRQAANQALFLANDILDKLKKCHNFELQNRAIYEIAESMLIMDQIEEAKAILKSIMPKALTENDVALRGKIQWAYCRTLLASKNEFLISSFDQAEKDLSKAKSWMDLKQLYESKAKYFHSLGESFVNQRDEAAQSYLDIDPKIEKSNEEILETLDQIQTISRLIGAKLIAGG